MKRHFTYYGVGKMTFTVECDPDLTPDEVWEGIGCPETDVEWLGQSLGEAVFIPLTPKENDGEGKMLREVFDETEN